MESNGFGASRLGGLPFLAGLAALVCGGCSSGAMDLRAPLVPPRGLIFTSVRAPLTVDFHGQEVSESCGETISFYVREPIVTGADLGVGDHDLENAVAQGGLSHVEYADYHYIQVLTVFCWMKVRAYGPTKPPARAAPGAPASEATPLRALP